MARRTRVHVAHSSGSPDHHQLQPTTTIEMRDLKNYLGSVQRANMAYKKMYLVPLGVALLLPLTFIISYTMAVLNDDVDPGFPYISDTGALPPASCVFGQLLNLGAALLGACIYIRYRHVDEGSKVLGGNRISPLQNNIATAFGVVSTIGMDLVANFQESNALVVHMIGAFGCFISGTIYLCIQTYFSYKLEFDSKMRGIVYIRLTLAALCVVLTCATTTGGTVATRGFHGDNMRKWRPRDGGWTPHLISTISEWSLVFAFCAYILTFIREFRYIHVDPPVVTVLKYPSIGGG